MEKQFFSDQSNTDLIKINNYPSLSTLKKYCCHPTLCIIHVIYDITIVFSLMGTEVNVCTLTPSSTFVLSNSLGIFLPQLY